MSAPLPFQRAVAALDRAHWRQELSVEHISAPQRLAPWSTGITADVEVRQEVMGSGRLILLFDPAGNDAWQGTFRCVSFIRADIDIEMASDPLLPGVGWAWLVEALGDHHADHAAPSGTVTWGSSESFGGLADNPATAQIEIRASWTPLLSDGHGMTDHLMAWQDMLCTAAGLAPLPDGVVALPGRVHGVRTRH